MRVALAADHAGYGLKERLRAHLASRGHEVIDLGAHDDAPSDYPDHALAAGLAVLDGRAERAILVCGSGVGVAVAANKLPGIRAAMCQDHHSAHQGVEHDDMNVLALGARVVGEALATELADAFLAARFDGREQHARRLAKLAALEARFTARSETSQSYPVTNSRMDRERSRRTERAEAATVLEERATLTGGSDGRPSVSARERRAAEVHRMADPTRATLRSWPAGVKTLSIDVGGTRLKASVLDHGGKMLVDKVRIDTPYPCPPEVLVESLRRLARSLPSHHRVSVGFPGLIRKGVVRQVPSLSRRKPGGPPDPGLAAHWAGFRLREALEEAFGVPTLVANDADVQGSGAIRGDGFELVVTLGTGVGCALFEDGVVLPHLELSHGHYGRGRSIDIALGSAERERIGNKRWNRRVARALHWLEEMVLFDRMYVGGGNAKHVALDLGPRVEFISNVAGITGGIRLWDRYDGPISRHPAGAGIPGISRLDVSRPVARDAE